MIWDVRIKLSNIGNMQGIARPCGKPLELERDSMTALEVKNDKKISIDNLFFTLINTKVPNLTMLMVFDNEM